VLTNAETLANKLVRVAIGKASTMPSIFAVAFLPDQLPRIEGHDDEQVDDKEPVITSTTL
jgi:hypothetical protein